MPSSILPARSASASVCWGWRARVTIAVISSALYWTAGASIFMLLSWTIGWALPVRVSRGIGQRLLHVAFGGFVGLLRLCGIVRTSFTGFDKWQPGLRGQIVAPNHPALWDAVFIMGQISGLTCVLKSSLLRNPLLRGGARLARFIPGSPPLDMVRQGVKAVKEGQNLLLFPEATRTRRHECQVNEIKGGVGVIAHQTHAPVWPLVVRTDSLYLSKGRPLWHWPERPVNIEFVLEDPIVPQPGESAQEVVARLREVYLSLLSTPLDDLARPDSQLQHRPGPADAHGVGSAGAGGACLGGH